METLHIIPNWFLGLNTGFEILFFIFTALIAFYAFRVYKLSDQKESRNFGLAFAFLSLSYLTIIFLNTLFLSIIHGNFRSLDFDDFMGLKNIGVLIYVVSAILGFITLFYTTLRSGSKSLYVTLLTLSLLAIGFSRDQSLMIYFISSLFLIMITLFYFKSYSLTKNKTTYYMALAMAFLFLSNLLMAFVGNYFLPNIYVLSVLLEIASYSLIIFSLTRIIKNGKKKK